MCLNIKDPPASTSGRGTADRLRDDQAIPLSLPQFPDDLHTTDLTESCMMKGHLRRTGQFIGEVTTALFRGLAAGATLEFMHENDAWDHPEACTEYGLAKTQKDLIEEGRELSPTVERDVDGSIHADILTMATSYSERFASRFKRCDLVGTELPIRCQIKSDYFDEPIEFASHVDLMFHDPDGEFGRGTDTLHVWDWKYRDKAPTLDYLSRNLQFAAYSFAVEDGEVMFPDKTWVSMGKYPVMSWVHLSYLKPFGRKTTTKDDEGNTVTFSKGDTRPERSIVKTPPFRPECFDMFMRQLDTRAVLIALGHFPTNPDPVGCSLCESREFCDRYDTAPIDSTIDISAEGADE